MNRAQWLVFKAHDAEWQEREKKAAPVKERRRVYLRAYWKERRRMLALAKKEKP